MQERVVVGHRLSPQQERLWLLQRGRQSAPYNTRCAVVIEGELDRETLREALRQTVSRHEILSVSFQTLPGMSIPLQVVVDDAAPDLQERDLSHLPPQAQEHELESLFEAMGDLAFNLDEAPLLRAWLLILSARKRVLLIGLPSLCADRAGVKNLVREISRCYSARKRGERLEPLTMQYADLAEWQLELLETVDSEIEKEFWREVIISDVADHNLPFGARPAAAREFAPRARSLKIAPARHDQVKSLAQRFQSGVPSLLLSCWAILIWRLTGQSDVLIGYAHDGRAYEEMEEELGLFAKYLPIRCRLEQTLCLAEVVERVNRDVSDASKMQEFFTWERFAGPSMGGTQPSCLPLCFDSGKMRAQFRAESVTFSIRQQEAFIDRFMIEVFYADDQDHLDLSFRYDSSLFSEEDITRLCEQFDKLLEGVIANPESPISRHEILSDNERRRLLMEFNATRKDYPRHLCLHQLFEAQARRAPENVAVVFGQRQLTYGELSAQANELAGRLRDLGAGPDGLIGVCIARSVEMVVAILGALKAGAAFVPIDPTYPKHRLSLMLEDCRPEILLTQPNLASTLPAHTAKVVCLDSDRMMISGQSGANLDNRTDPLNLAYVIYTSGSTGNPKGVMVTHRGLVNYLSWAIEAYEVAKGAGAPVHSPLGFDLTITSLFSPLLTGARATLIPDEDNIESLSAALRDENNFSLLKITPSHTEVLSQLLPAQAASSARALIIGGEALLAENVSFWREHAPNTKIINEYGPTETVVGCCVYQTTAGVQTSGALPIGCPIANTCIYLLDPQLGPVPAGVPGELFIGGEGVARGYLKRPELTAERFVPDPFSDKPGARLYKTGDLARFLSDDNIEYLGRNDLQVKIRGHRIEIGEIEASLCSHPAVSSAAVALREDTPGDKRLIAYAATRDNTSATAHDLREFLEEKLPEYMVPSAVVTLEALPLSPNGKIDRRRLPDPRPHLELARPRFIPARNAQEQALSHLFASVLGLPRVGIHDNFFKLGGDSILCIQVVGKASRLGLRLTPKLIFQHPTVAQLAGAGTWSGPSVPARGEWPRVGEYPPTPIQRWFFERRLGRPDHFNQALMLRLRRRVEVEQLQRALDLLVAHHEMLRLRAEASRGQWRTYVVDAEESSAVRVIDLRGLDVQASREKLRREVSEMQSSLSLSRGPVMRVGLVEEESGCQRMIWVTHHLAVDAVSWAILVDDLGAALAGELDGAEAVLGEKTASYKEWAERLVEWADSEQGQSQGQWWVRELENVIDRHQRQQGHHHRHGAGGRSRQRSGRLALRLSREQTMRLGSDVRLVTGARTDEALLWALACGLSVSGGEGMKLIEVEGHGRRGEAVGADLTRTVGWFTLIYPVAVEVNSRKSLREQITEVRRNVRRAQEASLGYAVAKYVRGDGEAGRRLRQMPEAEALFNYLGRVNERGAGGAVISGVEMDVEYCSAEQNKGSHRLEVNAVEVGGELEFEVSYSPEEVSEEEVREVIEGMKERIDEAIVESERWIEEIGRRCGVGVEEVEEVYALSPMQEGLLFHALYEAGGAAYWVQTRMKLEGEVDDRRMRQAWEEVVARREALRVSLLWEGVDRPVQVVRRTARVEMEVEDWRSMSEGEQEQEMGLRLRRERQEGVDIRRGPMMRVRLMRKQEREYEMQWSSHHLALDGWSAAIVLKEVLERYERGMGGQEAALEAEPVKYGQYVEWVEGCDRRKARRYWEARMKGVAGKTRLRVERVAVEEEGDRGEAYGKQEVRVSRDRSRVIEDEARRAGVTMNTVAQGGWAIVMGEYSGDEEVVYGATVSGRGIGMEGIEEVVGVCINTAPVRVEVRGEQSVGEWLRGIQRKEVEGREYEYVGLAEVQRWVRGAGRGEGAGEEGMFDALLVFENYPVDSHLLNGGGSLKISDVRSDDPSHYPITLSVTPGNELSLRLTYDRNRFEEKGIAQMLDLLQIVLISMAGQLDMPLDDFILRLKEENRRRVIARGRELKESRRQKLKAAKRKTHI